MRRVSTHGRCGAVPLEPQSDELCIPVLTDEQKSRIQAMKPMTKEEWDARQSVIRRVVDPETGRTRYDPWGKGRWVVRLSILGEKGVRRMLFHGIALPHVDPGPLQQQRPEPIPPSSPPVRPGVTYSESDTFDSKLPNCAGAPCKGH